MNYLRRAWRGEERLWKVAWLLGIAGNLLALVLAFFLVGYLLQSGFLSKPTNLMATIFGLEFLTYLPLSLVCMWRCAANVKTPKYKTWTREVLVIISILAPGWWLACAMFGSLTY